MQHPEEGIIHAWLDGALPPAEARAVESHVASCADCAAAVADARGIIAGASGIVSHLDVTPGGVIPATTTKPKRRWIFTALPSAIAATLIIGIGLFSTRDKTLPPELATPTPGVIRPSVNDSMPVAPPPREVAPQRSGGAAAQSANASGRQLESVQLPPAAVTSQKASVAAIPPRAAPQPPATTRRQDELRLEAVVVASTAADRSAAGPPAAARVATGAVGGVARAPASAASERSFVPSTAAAADSVPPFVGCYESVSQGTLVPITQGPLGASAGSDRLARSRYATVERYDRFALMDEAAPTPGQFAVRTLDTAGRPYLAIYGAGWSVQGDRAIVRASNGQVVVTLIKSDSGIISSGGAVRVISCRK